MLFSPLILTDTVPKSLSNLFYAKIMYVPAWTDFDIVPGF